MESKYAIVIDKEGYRVEFVLVHFVEQDEEVKEITYAYTMQEGENLIYDDISAALSMLKPRWDGEQWEEAAMPEEIEAARPEPIPAQPSEMDIILLAIAEIYEKISGGAA